MKFSSVLPIALLAACLVTVGCANQEGDTSPLPQQAPQARLEKAEKNVESSGMSPEQKQAAAEYLRQGAEGARRMKESAEKAGPPPGKS